MSLVKRMIYFDFSKHIALSEKAARPTVNTITVPQRQKLRLNIMTYILGLHFIPRKATISTIRSTRILCVFTPFKGYLHTEITKQNRKYIIYNDRPSRECLLHTQYFSLIRGLIPDPIALRAPNPSVLAPFSERHLVLPSVKLRRVLD